MLPKNKLREDYLELVKAYRGPTHPLTQFLPNVIHSIYLSSLITKSSLDLFKKILNISQRRSVVMISQQKTLSLSTKPNQEQLNGRTSREKLISVTKYLFKTDLSVSDLLPKTRKSTKNIKSIWLSSRDSRNIKSRLLSIVILLNKPKEKVSSLTELGKQENSTSKEDSRELLLMMINQCNPSMIKCVILSLH